MGRRAGAPVGRRAGSGALVCWWLALVTLLARLGVCDGDAPVLSARVERIGAMTFVVALNLSAAGEVDIVTTRASEYTDWASAATPPTLAELRAAVLPGGAISSDLSPPAYFRRTVRVPTSTLETRVLVDGAYNLQRPELSGAYGDFVVYPNETYVVSVAPRDDHDGVANVTALEVTTASAVSSSASLAEFGVVVSATTDGVVDAAVSAAAATLATLAPTFSNSNTQYETTVDAETAEVTVFGLPAAGGAVRVEVNGVVARAGPARFGGVVPSGAYSAGRTTVFYGRNAMMSLVVTAEDRVTQKTYQVRVTRSRSSEARLARLALHSAVPSPAFSPDVYTYTVSVPHDVTSIKVFAQPLDIRAQAVRVNAVLIQGVDVGGDARRAVVRKREAPYSRHVSLRVGSNAVVVEVTAHDATTKAEYRVEITRAYPDTDVELAFLEVTSVSRMVTGRHMGADVVSVSRTTHALTPVFVAPAAGEAATIGEHATDVEYRVMGVTIVAAPRDPRTSLSMTSTRLDGWSGKTTTGVTSTVAGETNALGGIDFDVNDLVVGRTRIALTATAEDSRHMKTSFLDVTRYTPGSETGLSDLNVFGEPGDRVPVLVPSFDPDLLEYVVTLDFDTEAVRVVPTAKDPVHALLRVNMVFTRSGVSSRTFPVPAGGELKITVAVTAHDGVSRRFYVVVAKRNAPHADASLATLQIMPTGVRFLVPSFHPDVLEYNLSQPLEHTVASIQIAPTTANSEYDRVLVNGARSPSGTLSRPIGVPPGFGNGVEMTFGLSTVNVVVRAQDGVTERTYTVHITRDPAPIYPNDATLRQLNVAPVDLTRLVPMFSPATQNYQLFVPARAAYVGVTPVANDVNVYKIEVNGVLIGNGVETRTAMAELLRREDVELRVTVFAATCAPSYRPDGYDATGETFVDVDGDGSVDLLMDGKYRPNWCTTKTYVVELLEYGPGAYEGAMRLSSGNAEHTAGVVREMTPYPSPFGDTAEFLLSLDQKQAHEFYGGVRSTGDGECDEYLCQNPAIDPSLAAMELRVASVRPSRVGDDPLPLAGADVGDALSFSPAFSNATRVFVAQVPSYRINKIDINVTAQSANVSGVFVDGARVSSGAVTAVVLNAHGATKILVEVVAGRTDVRRQYTVHVYRPLSNNAFLTSLAVQLGGGVNNAKLVKRVKTNRGSGAPRPVRACDLYDAAVRAANGVSFHPLCDDATLTNFSLGDNDPPNFAVVSSVSASVASSTETGRLMHPCDDDPEPGWYPPCLENSTASFSTACDDAAAAAGVLPVVGFHHEWFDYLVLLDDSTKFVSVLAATADATADRVEMGGSFRNCRAAPRSPGCAGRDVDAIAAWGWTAGDSSGGVVAVESGEISPPLDLKGSLQSTTASITVVAADGVTRRAYTLRAARENPPPDADADVVAGVGAFLEGLIAASPLGATSDTEVRFTLRFQTMDPLFITDASFRRELQTAVRDYVAYAAVAPTLATSATATATPRSAGSDSCRRRVAGENISFVPPGVDVFVTVSFPNSTANTSGRLLAWIDGAGWNDAPGFAFDPYLKSWGPIRALVLADDGVGVTAHAVPARFSPGRHKYEVTLPVGVKHRVPLHITAPETPLANEYAVAVNGVATQTGSAAYVSIPQCAIGPNHCDARRFDIEIEACVGVLWGTKTCTKYVFQVTIPAAAVFATDDNSLRGVVVASGSTVSDAAVVPLFSEISRNTFRHDVTRLTAFVPSADLFVFVTVTPNSPNHGAVFVNGKPVVINGTQSEPVNVSVASLLDAKAMGGKLTVRAFAENGAHRDTTLFVLSRDEKNTVRDLTASESLDPLEPLKGVWGFDGGGLPRHGVDMNDDAPVFVKSYPRLEPLAEGGPHVEIAAQTKTPAVVYWTLAVPWTREPSVREVVEAATRALQTGVRPTTGLAPTRLVVDNATFVAANVTVTAFVAASLNTSLLSGSVYPSDVEQGLVAGGVLGGSGTFGATQETRVTVRCLDNRVTYRAFFVTERAATGAGAQNDPQTRSGVTQAVVARPGQGACDDP